MRVPSPTFSMGAQLAQPLRRPTPRTLHPMAGWMDKLAPRPSSHFSSQNTTSTSQESETKSRTGEKSLSSLSFPWPGSSFLPWELYGVERKGGRWRLYCKFTPGRENQLKFLKEDDPPWLNPLLSPSPELIAWIIILDFLKKFISLSR